MAMPVLIKEMHHKLFFGPAAICLGTSYFCTEKFSFVPNCSNCIQIAWEEVFLAHDSIKLCLGIVSESAGWLVQHFFRDHAKNLMVWMTTCPCASLCIGHIYFARTYVFHIVWYLPVLFYVFVSGITETENMTVLKSGIVNGMHLWWNGSCAKFATLAEGKFSPSLTFMSNSQKILLMCVKFLLIC